MRKTLGKEFFNRDTKMVAQELVGKFLVRKIDGREVAAMITETEAYDGPQDLASHASKGLTGRTQTMFGLPGYFYVYLVYGMYDMLNVVTCEHGYPAAVLIRGLGGADGPGKLTKFLKIDRSFNDKPAAATTGLWFEDRGVAVPNNHIKKLPRVGVDYAGPNWSAKKWRFKIEGWLD